MLNDKISLLSFLLINCLLGGFLEHLCNAGLPFSRPLRLSNGTLNPPTIQLEHSGKWLLSNSAYKTDSEFVVEYLG